MHRLIEAGIKTGKVLKSAKTKAQKQAANRYRQLYVAMIQKQEVISSEEIVFGGVLGILAIIGIMGVIRMVQIGLIE